MKKDKIIYWVTTTIIVLVMIFSMYMMYTPAYDLLGLPHYLRTELLWFKIVGLIALAVPKVPRRIKEWSYAGFGIVLISASVAHFSTDPSIINGFEPLTFFVILVVSNLYWHKLEKTGAV